MKSEMTNMKKKIKMINKKKIFDEDEEIDEKDRS